MSIKAFPIDNIIERDDLGHYTGKEVSQAGMDLRDYNASKFAQQFLVGAVVPEECDATAAFTIVAKRAYEMADVMMKVREL